MNIVVSRCQWCGELLLNSSETRQARSDKKFCSTSHRAKFHRWFKNIQKHEAAAIVAIGFLADYLQHPTAQHDAVAAMVRIREKVGQEMSWAGVKAVR